MNGVIVLAQKILCATWLHYKVTSWVLCCFVNWWLKPLPDGHGLWQTWAVTGKVRGCNFISETYIGSHQSLKITNQDDPLVSIYIECSVY